ncbi:MAG: hypothetical protein K6C34_05630 [Alphaproteobacteria bacterium]|nr:hypothetical protein [Alphaproteobacteria bacterium]
MMNKLLNNKWFCWGLLSLWLAVCCFYIMSDANWTLCNGIDDYQFFQKTAQGTFAHGGAWGGRFYPLAFADYSILLPMFPHGIPVSVHFAFNCVTLIIAVVTMFELLKRISSYRAALFGTILLGSAEGFMQIQMYCIFSERLEFLIIALFLLGYYNQRKSDSSFGYVLMFLILVLATYIKETFFIISTIIALTELIFECHLKKKEKVFHYALLFNTFIFLCIYFIRRFFVKHIDNPYASVQVNVESICSWLTHEPIVILILVLGAIRAYKFIICKDRSQILWDAALFASVVHACAFPLLKLTTAYYVFPSVVLCVPAFALFIKDKTFLMPLVVVMAIAWHNIPLQVADVKFALEHRKSDIDFRNIVADYLNKRGNIYWLFERDTTKDERETELVQQFLQFHIRQPVKITRVRELPQEKPLDIVICSRGSSPSKMSILEHSGLTKLTEVHGICIFTKK